MLEKLFSLGTNENKDRDWNFKTRMLNIIAFSVFVLVVGYIISHILTDDDNRVIYFQLPYLFLGLSVFILNAQHRNLSAITIASIGYPICFIITCIVFGKDYHSEYLFLITVGTVFFFFKKRKYRVASLIYNMILFTTAKFYYLYHPYSLFYLDPDDVFVVNLSQGLTVILFIFYVVETTFRNKEKLNEQLKVLSTNQEAIIAERTLELERRNEELRRFAYISAHDLREPLRNIMGFAQLLNREVKGNSSNTINKYVNYISQNIGRMDTITKDVVNYLELEHLVPKTQSINTHEVVCSVIKDLMQEHHEKDIEIKMVCLPTLTCNFDLFKMLIYNLLKNAIQYCDKTQVRIRVDAQELETAYHFSVKDNGIGIETAYHDSIFVMFKRLHNDLNHSSSGIGLAICKKIVNAYQGEIWVESQQNIGSTFHFNLKKSS